MPKLDFCIVIPVYNEEKIILDTISKALKFSKKYNSKIIIVNDGSTDSTKKILSKNRNRKIVTVNKKNEGHGKAIITGYKKALRLNPKYILQIDSDDQISFNEFRKLYKFKDSFDCVVGKRKNRADPISRNIISFILNKFLIFILFGRFVTDANCPLRIIKKKFLSDIINKISYANIPNILISILAKRKQSYKSINVKHRERYLGVGIKYFKLFKLCATSILDILRLRLLLI